MADDLELSSSQYSVALVVFFVGYVIFEAPSNMILVRSRPSRYLPAIMVVWGGLTCAMAAIKTYHHLLILRVFVGILEAGFAPGILLIISSWYKRTEQSKRFAVFISAAILSGAFGGLLAGAITGGLEGAHGLRGWRWLFIVEGEYAQLFLSSLTVINCAIRCCHYWLGCYLWLHPARLSCNLEKIN
jgi:MFS family permease